MHLMSRLGHALILTRGDDMSARSSESPQGLRYRKRYLPVARRRSTVDTGSMSPPGNGRVLSHPAMGIVGALLVLAVLAPSCTSEPERRDLPDVDIDGPVESSTGAPSGGPAPTVPSDVATLPGRLAVLDAEGDLVGVHPDGSDEALLDDVEPGLSQVRQPSWSLDGSLAWVHLEATDAETVEVVIATSTGTGERPTEAATTIIPFYLSWDPTSSRIASLGPSTGSEIALGIVEVAGDAPGTTLDEGRPFYLSWAPGGGP